MSNAIIDIIGTVNRENKPLNGANLFCLAHDLQPLKTPIANRANKILSQLQKYWQIDILTATKDAHLSKATNINYAQTWYPQRLIQLLNKLRLE